MTQEELDAMMNGGVDIDELEEEATAEEASASVSEASDSDDNESDSHWPPPAPTDDNKMVNQLDDVTRESEEKSTEIFDIIENIGDEMMNSETSVGDVKNTLEGIKSTFETLHNAFPHIEAFKNHLEEITSSIETLSSEVEMLQNNGDQIMNIMDIMQYQDIHRQKIERVINVMRALSKYMNTLFSSQIEDSNRVSSAQHIEGDTHNDDVMGNDDIEALLSSFNT